MGILSNSSKASFLFKVSGSMTEMPVVNFSASEWISLPYSMCVGIATSSEIKSFDDIIGNESVLTIINSDFFSAGGDRYFHGVVRRFEHTGVSGRKFLYEVDIIPTLYLLSLRKNCRIFQKTTTQDIVKMLLEEAGITSDRYRFALENTDRKRGFCVQYQESDLDFINRLMEEEGIYYFFEHYIDKHVLVISDNLAVHVPIKGIPLITCNSGGGLVAEKESISNFTFSQRQTPEAFAHSNFNFKKPGLDLTTKKAESKEPQYEVYEYSALHTTQARGDSLAKVRMEQLVALQKQGHGQSSSCRLTPGYKFTLTDHNSESLNTEYLLVDVSHAGSQPQTLEEHSSGSTSYSNQFTVIPAKTQFRPTVKTIKPVVKGLQTAIVVGPKDEEIHTDEHGRVKVQFHWDRLGKNDEKSSCWLRVAQAWGGGAWGAQFIPRIGDEVLVDFLEGNPDRPIITGSVYNGDNLPINSLKKSKTQSGFRTKTHKGEGFNELRFDDATGAQEVYIHGEKDFKVAIKNNETKTVGNMLVNQVGKTATITAGEQLQLICGGASIVLDKSGKIVIHGTEVFVSGNTLHLDGKPIQLNMGGAAGITAALIPAEAAAGATGKKAAATTKAETSKKKPEHKQVTKEDMKNADNKVTQTYGKDIPENKKTPSAFDRSALEDNKAFHENGGGNENAYYHPLWNKIHINSDKANIGTPIHEDLHYYSSKKFGENFGSDLDEGTTEYFTRKLATNDRVGIYEDQYRQSAKIANGVGEQTLKDAYFKGDEKAISAVKKFMEPKTFDNYPVHLKELQLSYGI